MNNTTNKVSRPAIWVMGAVLLLALVIPFIAKAGVKVLIQPYTPVALTNVPATLTGTGNTNIVSTSTEFVDCRRVKEIGIRVTAKLTATNPSAATLSIPVYRSVDGVNSETTAYTTLLLTYSGTNLIYWNTNMNVGAFGYLKFGGYTSTATNNTTTNLTVTVLGKPDWNVFVGPDLSYP